MPLGGWLRRAPNVTLHAGALTRRTPGGQTTPTDEAQLRTETWYREYYARKGADRNDVLANRGVLFQSLAVHRALVEALRTLHVSREWKILDVGCGAGMSLVPFLSFGFAPESLYGIDLLEDRIAIARRQFPTLNFTCGDASRMQYTSGQFDLVIESTMFIQLTDERLAEQIAGEMVRVVKVGGYVVLNDWRYAIGHSEYRALTRRRIARLFRVGEGTTRICTKPGALVPPVGRFLSTYLPSLYFVTQRVMPWVVGGITTVLQRVA